MADALIRAITGTISDDAISPAGELWGLAVSGSLSTTAIIRVYDNVSFSAGVVVAQLQTNAVHGGAVSTFERYKEVTFPRPIRMTRGISIAADAGVERYWLYVSTGTPPTSTSS